MRIGAWFRPPRHVLTMFVVLTCVSIGTLCWLSVLLIKQDEALEKQRALERLEQRADSAAAAMQQTITELQSFASPAGPDTKVVPSDVSVLAVRADRLELQAGARLLYYPLAAIARPEASTHVFAEGEDFEFSARPKLAENVYSALVRRPDVLTRAGALARLARTYRRIHQHDAALRAYDQLDPLENVYVGGIPASLVARAGRLAAYEETGREADRRREARTLLDDLVNGRWRLARPEFEFYMSQAQAALGHDGVSVDIRAGAVRSAAAEWVWENRAGAGSTGERRVLHLSDGPALLIRRSSANESYAVVGGPRYLQALFEGVVPAGSAVAATDLEGNAVFGSSSVLRAGIVRTAASTKLPWNLHVSPSEPGDPGNSPRRTLLVSVLSVLAIILITGTYLILRAISREIRVARLQSDFVAAVSHEFRTPLSSLSQISEMLLGDRIPTEALRQKSYEILDRETRRLRTLVEGLLDFGRLEAGGAAYQFENIDAGELTRSVANEFQECAGPDGHVVELSLADKPAYIRADRDALHRALWNLLDNAAKYSPDCRAIRMEVAVTGERVTIAVCDRGVGVPLHEQQAIFSKFVRGAEPKARRIRGTGLGLAIVRHIAEAHGGTVRVASRPGEGSRFTLVLEAAEGGAR